MTKTEAINELIDVATAEVGYLEKRSCDKLDSKTDNAGTANFTKYWRDIKPLYQGLPWCAVFVTWCMEKSFGRENATKLLKHYPYIYCPQMQQLFDLNANPKRGDIVIFKRNGTFTHTGIVTDVIGDMFYTIEGNTSGGGGIIVANGGGVCKKSYSNSLLPGTKFCRPEYKILEEELTMTQYEELKKRIDEQGARITELRIKNGYYNYIDKNMNNAYKPTIQKLVKSGKLEGNEKGELMLTDDMMRILTILDRFGVFDS